MSLALKISIYLEQYNIDFGDMTALECYVDDAIIITKMYMNNDNFSNEDIKEKYGVCIVNAIVKTLMDVDTLKKSKNCKSMSQGARSMTFNDIQTNLKVNLEAELPFPFMRMV